MMSKIFSDLQAESEKQQKIISEGASPKPTQIPPNPARVEKPTSHSTQTRDRSREISRDNPRKPASEKPTTLPTRDEIQEFSFRMRDALKVKVQAEVPYLWQDQLEETARNLNVKKLELYRFILGEFLGKVSRKGRGVPTEE